MPLYCLAYISERVVPDGEDADPDFLAWELEQILQASARNNPSDGITGVLMSTDTLFLQYVEGRQRNVRECFDRIERDPRHKNIKTLVYKPVEQRVFADWSMAQCPASAVDQQLLRSALAVPEGTDEATRLGEVILERLRAGCARIESEGTDQSPDS